MSLEKLDKKENAEELAKKEKEIDDGLMKYGSNADEDKKFLEKTSGNDIAKSVHDDLKNKSKELNDPKSQAKVEALTKNIESYSKL